MTFTPPTHRLDGIPLAPGTRRIAGITTLLRLPIALHVEIYEDADGRRVAIIELTFLRRGFRRFIVEEIG